MSTTTNLLGSGIRFVAILIVTGAMASGAVAGQAASIGFDQRVEAQRAIEQVYWDQRLWPGDPGSKPPLEQVMSDAVLAAKVEDYLKKSGALETLWHRPITGEQLQAELDRMIDSTRAPETLKALFAALGNDPFVITETLVRQKLVDRLMHDWYAGDTQMHLATRLHAEQVIAGSSSADTWTDQGGERGIQRFELRSGAESEDPAVTALGDDDWRDLMTLLGKRLGSGLPVGTWSRLHDDSEAFVTVRINSRSAEAITFETVSFPKKSFDEWWLGESIGMGTGIDVPAEQYTAGEPDGSCASGTWSALPSVPQGRQKHAAIWTGSEMIVWGGGFGVGVGGLGLRTGGRYDPATNTWQSTSKDGAPGVRTQHSAVWTGTELIVWGGRDGIELGTSTDTGGRYNPSTDTWQSVSMSGAPSAREEHSAVWTGTEMIVWSGLNHDGEDAYTWLGDGGVYDPATDSWSSVSVSGAPTARTEHTAVWTGDEMIVWGGYNDGDYPGGGGRYDPVADTWTSISDAGLTDRSLHTAVWTGSEMVVWGGQMYDYYYYDGGVYDPDTNTWSPTSNSHVPEMRSGHTAVWTGSQMIVWGGENASGELASGGLYDPFENSWVTMNGFGMPYSRVGHTAVWTGTEMIVWGGSALNVITGIEFFETGGRYDPVSDSWVSTFASGAPTRRAWHSAVWTGSEMIVWGGFRYGGAYFKSGGIYDPATDQWSTTSTGNAPVGRRNHTAVWTGTEMIVWGGYSVAINVMHYNSGGRYNPATNSWIATPTSGAGTPRQTHTAVWTGSEMIIWGGGSGAGVVDTGRRYDPVTDSWGSVAMDDAPSVRYKHTAVWTGSEMIVWGGGGEGHGQNTGGRYDPVANVWTPTTTVGAPPGSQSHVAAWTGSKMIVWGGLAFGGWDALSTGGVYDPADDSWTLTSLVDAPVGRERAVAAWSGSNFIVWGGKGEDYADLNSGGIYNLTGNNWTPTAVPQSPKPRWEHTGVWSGTEMLVFGGESENAAFLADGGRFCMTDTDFDGQVDHADCDPFDSNVWTTPGEIGMLDLTGSVTTQINWEAPESPGASSLTYDVVRADGPSGFASPTCIVSDTVSTVATDVVFPAPDSGFYYLVIAKNGCGSTWGAGSSGSAREVSPCP